MYATDPSLLETAVSGRDASLPLFFFTGEGLSGLTRSGLPAFSFLPRLPKVTVSEFEVLQPVNSQLQAPAQRLASELTRCQTALEVAPLARPAAHPQVLSQAQLAYRQLRQQYQGFKQALREGDAPQIEAGLKAVECRLQQLLQLMADCRELQHLQQRIESARVQGITLMRDWLSPWSPAEARELLQQRTQFMALVAALSQRHAELQSQGLPVDELTPALAGLQAQAQTLTH